MIYMIDFDSRKVLCASEEREELERYVEENDLSLAICLIESAEELSLELSMEELTDVSGHIAGNAPMWNNENEASESVWALLESENFKTKPPKTSTESVEVKPEVKPKVKAKTPSIRANNLTGMVFCNTDKTPRAGTAFAIVADFIDDNIGTATFEELVENFVEVYRTKDGSSKSEKFAMGYVRGAFKDGYIEEDL